MVALFSEDIFFEYFNESRPLSEKRIIINILYNESVSICFSKHYIDILNRRLGRDAFQALIVELSDNDRLKIENCNYKSLPEKEFVEIYKNCKNQFIFPVLYSPNNSFGADLKYITVASDNSKYNRNWLILELLSKNLCNVSYQDFKSEEEVKTFFNAIFLVPKYITIVKIFDRERSYSLLGTLKGKYIEYYTLLSAAKSNEHIRIMEKKDLRNELGGKLRLFYTNNPRILHERKIIIGNILVTADNSYNNLIPAEPTWEVVINYDENKAKVWHEKSKEFREVKN